MLGILKAGGAYLPLDPSYPRDRMALVIEDSQTRCIVTTEQVRESLPACPARIISLDAEASVIAAQSEGAVTCCAAEENLAYVMYTSGSTGRPKGVMVEHRNVVNFFDGMDEVIGVEPGVWLAVTSISFDISVLELLWTLSRGFKVVMHSTKDTQEAGAEIVRHGVTHFQSTPSLAHALASDPQSLAVIGSLKKLLLGGEALPPSLVRALRQSYSGEIYNMYGPTETAVWSTSYCVEGSPDTLPIGAPILNTQVYVLDSELRPAGPGEQGELFIGGDGVVRGYWNRPELTAERFISDPFRQGGRLYRTGDLARFLPDGNLEYLGRTDFQVKIRGYRVELGEIEAALELQPGVQQAVVAAQEDNFSDKVLVAYIVARNGEPVSVDALRGALEAQLPDYMVPSRFVPFQRLPLTPNGKIDRKALPYAVPQGVPEPEGADLDGEVEQMVAEIWVSALGLPQVRRGDNFFELGGHSLTALKIAFKIQQTFQVDFPLQTFIEMPVLSEQARKLEEMLLEQGDTSF